MSKIEDALNKIKRDQKQSGGSLRLVANTENRNAEARSLMPSNNDRHLVRRETSSKEIALMEDESLLTNAQLSELKIIYSVMKNTRVLNKYRDLRTNLIQKSGGSNFTVMITSCYQGHNTGYTTINLASAFSFDESKTSLVIDCNMINPAVDKILRMKNVNAGLTDYFENEELSTDKILYSSGIKRLRVIPAGQKKEYATEIFTSSKMRLLMRELLERYSDRYVFLNSSPIIESADSKILVDLCDYVILEVPYGRVTKKKIVEAAKAIGKEKLLGVIFTETPELPRLRIPGLSRQA